MPGGKKEERNSRFDGGGAPGRLRGRRDIDALFRGGKRLQGKRLVLIYRTSRDGSSRFSVFVPKRLGGAVRRNRARRVLREALRQNPHEAAAGREMIILCRRPVGEESIAEARKELFDLLDRLSGDN